jgi:hypothetical protein
MSRLMAQTLNTCRTVRPLAVASSVVAAVGASWLAYYLFGAAVDNRVGILIARDMRIVQGTRLGDRTVREVINQRFKEARWSGWHREEVWRTFVECRVRDANRGEIQFVWEVNRGFSPPDGTAGEGVFVFALTRDAGVLTPQYLPHGLTAAELPLTPTMTARALHGASRHR